MLEGETYNDKSTKVEPHVLPHELLPNQKVPYARAG